MPRPPSLVFRHCHSVRRERDGRGRPKINSWTSEEGFISGENGERDKDGVKEAEIGSERREKSPTEREIPRPLPMPIPMRATADTAQSLLGGRKADRRRTHDGKKCLLSCSYPPKGSRTNGTRCTEAISALSTGTCKELLFVKITNGKTRKCIENTEIVEFQGHM